MSYRSHDEPRRTTVGQASASKPYVPQYHSYSSDIRQLSTSPAPSQSSATSLESTTTDARMPSIPSVFAPAPSIHRAQTSQQYLPPVEAQRVPPQPYSDYRSAETASIHSVTSTHSVPARFSRPMSSSSASSAYGNRVLPLPGASSSTTPHLEHRRPPSYLDNVSSPRHSTFTDPDHFRLRVSESPHPTSALDEPPIHLPPILSPGLSRKRSSSSIASAFSYHPEPQQQKARSIRSFQSSFDDRSSLRSVDARSDADPLDFSLPQGWTGPSEPRKVGRSSAAAARIMQRRMKKNQLDSAAMGIEDELAKTDIEEDILRYVFVVVQQPVRARACGFGDKDRRPLSPTPIIKCIVYDRQGRVVDPMNVQIHELVMSMDLWDETGMQERNLIVHPFVNPAGVVTPHSEDSQPDTDMMVDEPEPINRGMSRTPQPDLAITGWSPPPEAEPAKKRPPVGIRQPSLESTNSLGREAPPLQFRPLQTDPYERRRSSTSTFVSTAPSYSTRESFESGETPQIHYNRPSEMYRPSGMPEVIPERSSLSSTEERQRNRRSGSIQVPTDAMSAFSLGPPSSSSSSTAPLFAPVSPFDRSKFSPASSTLSLPPLAPPPVAGNYSRALFGGLVTTAHRLTDLDGEPGIFFFGHEVSVRAEGRFRLRFCLMKVGQAMFGSPSPLLAEVLSEPFTVMSAKRFVGVLDTTDLTRHFLKQGVKLPIRRKKAAGAAGSDDEDD